MMVREAPASYRIRVDGHLDEHWSASFGGMSLTRERDGTTSLTGDVRDQAQLYGLLAKVRDLGLTLLSVVVVGSTGDVDRARLTSTRSDVTL